jgi:hypothetical protein
MITRGTTMNTSPSRRRQRSVRVTVAVALLSAGTVAVVVALALASVAALSLASALSLVCGWAAARIVWTEVVESRRVHARDRAEQAQSFQTLFTERSTEHAAFAAALGDRLTARERQVRELEGTLRLSERRATVAEERVRRESRRANQAQERVSELEVALAIRTAEEADELASWVPGGYDDLDTVVDLLSWEDRPERAGERTAPALDEVPVQKRA